LGYTTDYLNDTLKGDKLDFNISKAKYNKRFTTLSPYLALASLTKYRVVEENTTINKDLSFLNHKQYVQIMKLLKADRENGGDGTNIRNNLLGLDIEVSKDYTEKIYEFGEDYKEFLSNLMWLKDGTGSSKFSLGDIKSWWQVDIENILYNHTDGKYGANSTIDVGFGAGPYKDNYGVVVRGGKILDLLQGTTGIDSDTPNSTDGIGFRGATPYIQ
jgi:hypothetical protein